VAIDLHTHSAASDGTDTPSELVSRAHAAGLTAIALTDHDTLSGIEEARLAADRLGIDLVPGTELSVRWPTGKMHMLVYFLEPGPGPLQDELSVLRDGRADRNSVIVERIGELGYELTLEEVLDHAHGESVGRPHIADALVARGYFPDRSTAFDELLGDGKPAYVSRLALDAHTAIRLAAESGALTAIAHPYTIGLNRDEYLATFRDLAAAGLDGIESHHAEHTPRLRAHLASLAADLGLVATGGSDYHGAGKPGISLGSGRGDLAVPDEFLERLRERR
jgi:3',5'-nucleoside bisphosphate phosphatase